MSQRVTVHTIVTHHWPHFDELLAIRLLKRHGEGQFKGIQKALIEYQRNGEVPYNRTWEENLQAGVLTVGVGGGPFDEHPTSQGEERKKRESACSLVAKQLGLDKHPVYKRLIELVTECDQQGVHEMHAANRLKARYRLRPNHPEKAIDFALDILDDWEAEQNLFLEAQSELRALANTDSHIIIPSHSGQLDLVVVDGLDNFKLSAAARSLRIAIIIQKNTRGQVQIFCDTERYDFNMRFVIAELRKAEMQASGMSKAEIAKLDATYLEREGKIAEVKNWFYQVPGHNCLNGSESTPDTLPTKLCLTKIVKIVKNYIFAEVAV